MPTEVFHRYHYNFFIEGRPRVQLRGIVISHNAQSSAKMHPPPKLERFECIRYSNLEGECRKVLEGDTRTIQGVHIVDSGEMTQILEFRGSTNNFCRKRTFQ